jgi:hypothetical protein
MFKKYLLIQILCSIIFISPLNAEPIKGVAYFDHYAHGVGRPLDETPSLCSDHIDNDSDGVRDPSQACSAKLRSRLLACTSCHQDTSSPSQTKNTPSIKHAHCEGCHNTTNILARAGSPSVPYCRSCHINAQSFRFPPFRQRASTGRFLKSAPEGGWSQLRLTRFDHELHSRWAGGCETCHTPVSDRPTSERERRALERAISKGERAARGSLFDAEFAHGDHQACASCHSPSLGAAQPKLSVQMGDCEACHQVLPPQAAPSIKPSQTTGFFRHANHSALINASPCRLCHTNTGYQANERFVQLPSMSTCSTCHGGSLAFDLGPSHCARCHIQEISAQ